MIVRRLISALALIGLLFAYRLQAQETDTCPMPQNAAELESLAVPPRDRAELASRLMGFIVPEPATTPPDYQIGDKETFYVVNDDESVPVLTTLRAISDHIYLWVESAAASEISDAELEAIAHEFDTRVYPETRALWGDEANPGFDGDARIHGVFTNGLGATAAAYFSSDNSAPVGTTTSGNGHEMFMFNLEVLSYGVDLASVTSIVAHEFHHMIRNNLQPGMELWMNEGISEFTQLYLFDDPGYSVLDFFFMPGTQLNTWAEEGSLRGFHYGAALAWITYFYERYGIGALEQAAASESQRGLSAFDLVLQQMGEPGVNELFADWVIANSVYAALENGGVYDYTSFPYLSDIPPFHIPIEKSPFATSFAAAQYASDPYSLNLPFGASSIDISIEAPASVAIIPDGGENQSRFMYSNRADMGDSTLTRAFDLTGIEDATLNFRLWHDLEDDWDYGYVMASTDGGAAWEILEGARTANHNPHGAAYGAGYNGESGGWVNETISLSDYAGQEILLRFEVITDDGVNRPGMAVDDLEIPEIGYFEDFESSCDDWEAAGWANILNHTPQNAWVQVVQLGSGDLLDLVRWQLNGAQAENALLSGEWSVPVADGAEQAVIIISPFAPLTTEPMPYSLNVNVQ